MTNWQRLTTPHARVTTEDRWGVVLFWSALCVFVWIFFKPVIFPAPWDVVAAFPSLWTEYGVGQELLTSLTVMLEALGISVLIALPLAYLSRVALVSPLALAASNLRFLSPAVYFVPLLFMTGSGHALKVAMLVSGQVFFILASMLDVVMVPSEKLDDARTLRMNEWEVTYYAVIRGTLDQVFDQLRVNAAMAFGMLMMVEGVARAEGGLGVLLIDFGKYRDFPALYGIAALILAVGLAQDWGIRQLKTVCCPYAALKTR